MGNAGTFFFIAGAEALLWGPGSVQPHQDLVGCLRGLSENPRASTVVFLGPRGLLPAAPKAGWWLLGDMGWVPSLQWHLGDPKSKKGIFGFQFLCPRLSSSSRKGCAGASSCSPGLSSLDERWHGREIMINIIIKNIMITTGLWESPAGHSKIKANMKKSTKTSHFLCSSQIFAVERGIAGVSGSTSPCRRGRRGRSVSTARFGVISASLGSEGNSESPKLGAFQG